MVTEDAYMCRVGGQAKGNFVGLYGFSKEAAGRAGLYVATAIMVMTAANGRAELESYPKESALGSHGCEGDMHHCHQLIEAGPSCEVLRKRSVLPCWCFLYGCARECAHALVGLPARPSYKSVRVFCLGR